MSEKTDDTLFVLDTVPKKQQVTGEILVLFFFLRPFDPVIMLLKNKKQIKKGLAICSIIIFVGRDFMYSVKIFIYFSEVLYICFKKKLGF